MELMHWRAQVVLHGIRWANNILTEVAGNHASALPTGAREHLTKALSELHEAEDAVRYGKPAEPSGSEKACGSDCSCEKWESCESCFRRK